LRAPVIGLEQNDEILASLSGSHRVVIGFSGMSIGLRASRSYLL
jgi:hypothetical protein